MNEKIVLALICSFCIVSASFSMDREALRRSLGKFSDTESSELEDEMKGIGASPFIFELSSSGESQEVSSDETDQKSSCLNFVPSEQLKLPQESESSDDMNAEDFICATCERSLLNSSFDYIEELNRYACLECAQNFFELFISASKSNSPRPSEVAIARALPAKPAQEFEDDEPFFDHKKGNAHSHSLSQIYRAKRSFIQAAKQNAIHKTSFRQGQLGKLQTLEEQ